MHPPDPIETALMRLMPPALSETCERELGILLDGLAAKAGYPPERSSPWPLRWMVPSGIAAAAVVIAAFSPGSRQPDAVAAASPIPAGVPAGLVLMSESDRIETMTDEGWRDGEDGGAMHAVRIEAIGESSLMDEETGIVVQISEPREEVLFMPISAF